MRWGTEGGPEPNTGSRARDHLANERTYLAWLRTGISMAALGVAVAKLIGDRGVRAVVAGILLVIAGLLLSIYGTMRYRSVGRQLEAGVFAPARSRIVIAMTLVTLVALLAGLILI
ncbi:YidH family protein [Streptomyces sp. MMS24-I31]|uniref:YidH family protein n=1 Tax=Streptomyces sp. MMS24-I31 TaxID=3351563 RepID=UPI003896E274